MFRLIRHSLDGIRHLIDAIPRSIDDTARLIADQVCCTDSIRRCPNHLYHPCDGIDASQNTVADQNRVIGKSSEAVFYPPPVVVPINDPLRPSRSCLADPLPHDVPAPARRALECGGAATPLWERAERAGWTGSVLAPIARRHSDVSLSPRPPAPPQSGVAAPPHSPGAGELRGAPKRAYDLSVALVAKNDCKCARASTERVGNAVAC